MRQITILSFLIMSYCISFAQTKVACIGNSITYGSTLKDPSTESYPSQLQMMLGKEYIVKNFGEPGSTLLQKGHSPYILREGFRNAMKFKPDIAVIHLGINDTDPRDWPKYGDDFIRDYLNIIDSLRSSNKSIRIIIARMTPIWDNHERFNSGTKQWHFKIQKNIEIVAELSKSELIDYYRPFIMHPELFNDCLHPNNEGAKLMAETAYHGITGYYGGLSMPMIYSDNMVIQKDKPIKISGTANSGDKVSIVFDKKKLTAITSTAGMWSVTFPAIEKPRTDITLKISTETESITYRNICVGEVWLCSGQSNMLMKLSESSTADEDIPHAEDKHLRFFNMKPIPTDNIKWSKEQIDSINHLKPFRDTKWESSTPESTKEFSAIAYHFGKILRDSLQMPVGLILNAVGGAPQEAWIERETLENNYPLILRDWINNNYTQKWCRERALMNMSDSKLKYIHHSYEPGMLFEAGIKPLDKYAIKGVIWYQGESNEHCCETFEELFRLFINNIRQWWNTNNLPVYYAQLSSLNRPEWPLVRDMQRRMIDSIDYVGMAVTSDIGEINNVHPKKKKDVGERLARWALNRQYFRKSVIVSGPLIDYAENNDGNTILRFKYSHGLHSSDNKDLRSFEVAEFDGLYYPAEARIEHQSSDDIIVVSSSKINRINFVRYGWSPYTDANMVNSDNLPASTFKVEVK